MIESISGKVVHKEPSFVVIDTGGLGYKVSVTSHVSGKIAVGQPTDLWTHMAVRENAMELFGFLHRKDLDFFSLLIAISGIGPRTALSILNLAPVETIEEAVANDDAESLSKVSGIGARKAEKIVVELRDKLSHIDTGSEGGNATEALEALEALGYSRKEAREVIKKAPKEISSTEGRVKYALKQLGTGY